MSDEYPQFRTVLRGYDPAQVEEVLDEVFTALDDAVKVADDTKADLVRLRTEHEAARTAWRREQAQAQARATELEHATRSAPATFENLGSHIGSMLSAADEEAAEIRRSAQDEAQRLRDEATAAASTTRAEADAEHAARLADHEAQLHDARARVEAVEAYAAERRTAHEQHRAQVRARLDEVRRRITELVDPAAAEAASDGGESERVEADTEQQHPVTRDASGVVPRSAQHGADDEEPDGADESFADESFTGEPWSREDDGPTRRRGSLSSRR